MGTIAARSDGLVSVYANATTASETAVPVRQIRLPRDAMTVNDMKLDIPRDRLYVAVGRQYDDAWSSMRHTIGCTLRIRSRGFGS